MSVQMYRSTVSPVVVAIPKNCHRCGEEFLDGSVECKLKVCPKCKEPAIERLRYRRDEAIPPTLQRQLCVQCISRICHHFDAPPPRLSMQEMHILRLLGCGLTNKEIGAEMDLVEGTVKIYVMHVFRKLGLTSRLEAALWALKHEEAIR